MNKFHIGILMILLFAPLFLINQVRATRSHYPIENPQESDSLQASPDSSFTNTELSKSEFNAMHNNVIKDNEILLLKKDLQIDHLELERLKQQRSLLYIIGFILIAFITFIYIRLNTRKKNIKLLEEKNLLIKKQRAELEQINASKDKLFSIIAHDLKNPFNSILGFINELHTNYDDFTEEERKHMIKILSNSSNNAYALLNNLLTWSRNQRGHIKIKKEFLNLKAITDEALTLYSASAIVKKINLKNEVPESIKIYADKNTIRTALGNICNNSIKFTPEGGHITITAINKATKTHISIIDNGIGMDLLTLNNLFKVKKGSSRMGTNKEKGTGLGLIICKEFIEKNKGKLLVESTEGEGSVFRIQLPNYNGK